MQRQADRHGVKVLENGLLRKSVVYRAFSIVENWYTLLRPLLAYYGFMKAYICSFLEMATGNLSARIFLNIGAPIGIGIS